MDSEDIFLTKDIYPIVAVWLQKKPGATGRAIERLAALLGFGEIGAG